MNRIPRCAPGARPTATAALPGALAFASLALALLWLAAAPAPATAAHKLKHCALPKPGQPVHTATPRQVGLDPADVRAAMDYAVTHNRLSVRIQRFNCLVATSPQEAITEQIPWNVFSSTKSVVSLAAGVAWDEGKLDLHAPIGRYIPKGIGDAAHRAITVRDLLTETAGLKQSIISETGTTGTDPNVAKEAMALPLVHKPGSFFDYTQRVPDLLAYVVSHAVGMDFQRFVQRKIFGPIGIEPSDYFWLRDRSGNTYGYAHLFIKSAAFSHIGLLLGHHGRWRGAKVISKRYIHRLSTPTRTNPCYGFLFWVNRGRTCTTASIPSRRTLHHRMIPSAPKDLYATVGAFQQNNFILPSQHMVVTWTGVAGDLTLDPQGAMSANPGSTLYHDFFRKLLRGVTDQNLPDKGPYPGDPPNWNFDVDQFSDPLILAGGLGIGPDAPKDCNVLVCGDDDLTRGPQQMVDDLVSTILGQLPAGG